MNLTQNFTLSEMTKSETALRYGMANDPTDTEIENMNFKNNPDDIQGPPKNLPRSIYPISSIAHPNQTLSYNCVELLDEK